MKASRVIFSCLVVVAATAVVASAADRRPKAYSRGSKARVAAPHVKAPNVLLFDQTAGTTGIGIVSQDFESVYDAYDAMGAADFPVPAAQTWSITGGFFPGAYFNGPGPTPGLNLVFYSDAGGMPGAVIPSCNYPGLVNGVNFTSDAVGNLTLTSLPAPCVLATGTYWVQAQAKMDFGVGGEWGWLDATNTTATVGKWQNPGGGFGTGCNTWGDLQTCIAAGENNDWGFQLTGTLVPVELQDFTIE
jgi:hypothetical protein